MHIMQNYSVENDLDVDFFAALKKLQQSSEPMDQENGQDNCNDDVCLITNEPLNAFHVKLACGHAFNYEPLYQEVMRQKGRMGMHNYFEKIGTYQIKCPYCRSMTNQLLPYIGNSPHPMIKRLVGVNAPANMCMPGTPCGANQCHANAFYEHNQKLYCYRHHKIAIKPKSTAAKSTVAKSTAAESTIPNASRCVAENQTGKNKGKRCRLKASQGSTLCKTHAKCNLVVTLV
jgi:hypothetical protein